MIVAGEIQVILETECMMELDIAGHGVSLDDPLQPGGHFFRVNIYTTFHGHHNFALKLFRIKENPQKVSHYLRFFQLLNSTLIYGGSKSHLGK